MSAVERLCKWLYVLGCGCVRGCKKGGLLWNWVVNSLCLSADYSGTGLGPQAWENPPLSKNCEHNPSQKQLPNHGEFLVTKHIVHKTEQLILTGGFFCRKSCFYSQFVCPDLCKRGCGESVNRGMTMLVTANGDFCQVFLVLLSDWDSQAEACPSSLRPGNQSSDACLPKCLAALAGSCSHPTHLFIIFLWGLVL